ncbi:MULTISPECIES: ZIP family metal transporter [Pontibacter]|uniref:Zinc transporter ZupT n=1 Tax=Pontibacter lucknowensis TaxID=1077936 RepID=A0A1N6UUC2_9BACT|nr:MULTISPECIES: ZIP family metal transporter [Pontibacter]EJF09621.1 zinc/iron permease [Pontibacter sp. BAB1700]SIQ69234.1 Zinc transporter ZupT [Pontibacter lucknowensis]
MIIAILVLFFTVVLSSFLVKVFPPDNSRWLKMALAFSGAYLFTITIVHLLPDVLLGNPNPHRVGYWVLAGFFLQLVLELFSHGVEHGHMHTNHHSHGHVGSMPFLLLGSLFIHSFLEGSILVEGGERHVGHHHTGENFYAVLLGIAIHHVPAAFALMSVLMSRIGSFRKAFLWLLIFAVGSPLGILVSNYIIKDNIGGEAVFTALTGLVAGNFLHISTTILFETSPDHRFNRNKLLATLFGLGLALLTDLL